ncbi:hypothetical protein O3M35_006649 [Rhynocoris fuscipes]|uniref:Uncharacterized protein n=1 Tax=Rhynocoris fuscipes TaxID=488301 RepID=A0AAW1DGY1_9HEMI
MIYFIILKSREKSGIIDNVSALNHFRSFPPDGNYSSIIVEVSVFYEYLCSDSRRFFIYQLLPTVEKLQSNVVVNLIPYGKATTKSIGDGEYIFKCQHGQNECKGNLINACIIDSVHDNLIMLKIITCMIDFNTYTNIEDIAEICCDEYNINWENIKYCLENGRAHRLLKLFGSITAEC